eukprot:jgi/Pico_ML_1/53603/g4125.t1
MAVVMCSASSRARDSFPPKEACSEACTVDNASDAMDDVREQSTRAFPASRRPRK